MKVNKGAFKKGEKRPKQGKRGPGKLTVTVKEAFETVFRDLQAEEDKPYHLTQWAKTEPREFYKIAAKLIPTDIKAQVDHTLKAPELEVVAAALGLPPPKK